MHVINARNVNDAYVEGVRYLFARGEVRASRAGEVLVAPEPVTTVYSRPLERVLFDARRDANPFFHLFEALWMLAGRNDARWLDFFVKDFSSRFAEEDGIQHGAYGYRWREAFGFDQLDAVVEKLGKNPDDRQAVIQMWDATGEVHGGYDDLLGNWKDRPCNTHVYLRVREKEAYTGAPLFCYKYLALDITVCCRSNDIIWGAYGANAVHFSLLQEYLAARIGVEVGTYYQISNNYHAYTAALKKLDIDPETCRGPYTENVYVTFGHVTPIVTNAQVFDVELRRFLENPEAEGFDNFFFDTVARPMYRAYMCFREKEFKSELAKLAAVPSDWTLAAMLWLQRRYAKAREVTNG